MTKVSFQFNGSNPQMLWITENILFSYLCNDEFTSDESDGETKSVLEIINERTANDVKIVKILNGILREPPFGHTSVEHFNFNKKKKEIVILLSKIELRALTSIVATDASWAVTYINLQAYFNKARYIIWCSRNHWDDYQGHNSSNNESSCPCLRADPRERTSFVD